MNRSGLVALVLAVAFVAGCGGGSHAVPSVVGERLDVAESTVKDAGLGYEEIGGGVFGIVVPSHWTVCRQDPPAGATTSGKVSLIVSRSC